MFDTSKKNADLVDDLCRVMRSYSRGDTIPHGEMLKAVGMESPGGPYYGLLMRARKRLNKETGIWSHCISGVGLRLQTHEESIHDEQVYRGKRIRKQSRIGASAVTYFHDRDMQSLPQRMRDAIRNIQESAKQIERASRDASRVIDYLLKPTPTNPKFRLVPPRPREDGQKTG